MAGLADLVTPNVPEGGGALIGIRGDTNTGKSVLAACAPDPVLYINMDYNVKYVRRNAKQPGGQPSRLEFHHVHTQEDTIPGKQAVLRNLNRVWSSFLTEEPSPTYGEPYKSCVWDTAGALWDFISDILVELRIQGKNREAQPFDFKDANSWMRNLADSREALRPDGFLIMLFHEQPVYVPDPKSSGGFMVPDPAGRTTFDGWKHSVKYMQLYLRLFRKAQGLDRNGKPQTNVRYGQLLKDSLDEQQIRVKSEFPEPTWRDIQELLEE